MSKPPVHAELSEPADVSGEKLILAAFGQAADRGRNPQVMQAGALKNRLLNLTDRTFDESAWGVRSFMDFLALFPSTVETDRTVQPPDVVLTVEDPEAPARALAELEATPVRIRAALGPPPEEGWRIRSDLWTSVLDVNDELVYIWDGSEAVAVEQSEVDPSDVRQRLPTLSEAELHFWRAEFVTMQPTSDPALKEAMATWRDRHETSWSLPQPIRRVWFGWLKERVRDQLVEWFDKHDIPLPEDFYETRVVARGPAAGDEVESLRRFVTRCVQQMTFEELRALQLPAAAAARLIES